ncbi:multicopper oxidase-domain-containing protein [Lasiosphaeria hispida]|uniref:Multicopper oxidase-domain-containing protein n=1 Tax=Lasiosphaeria hispida TaxID=260671 RepID=A0AAJ0HNV3_9PEZI|nr:multicopper oxidase-domain-containing protein [Lasiosphaeria hispida]
MAAFAQNSWLRLALRLTALSTVLTSAYAKGPTFELTLTWDKWSPDGVERDMILVNGRFPAPTLEINQGELVEVVVHNKMPSNTTVHFHGIDMHATPWSDGVPGVTQRQIGTNETFHYKWQATQHGSYWYHAHQLGQVEDGMYGAIVIHPRNELAKPWSLISQDEKVIKAIDHAAKNPRPLLLADHRRRTADDIVNLSHQAKTELPCFDSILFNGKGSVNCIPADELTSLLTPQQANVLKANNVTNLTPKGCLPPSLISKTISPNVTVNMAVLPKDVLEVCTPSKGSKEVITVQKQHAGDEKWLALDLIGAFHLLAVVFSIDEHPVWVYAVDGDYIKPQLVHAIQINNGDRYSILVQLNNPGKYPVRIASVQNSQVMYSSATLLYSVDETGPAPERPTVPYVKNNGLPASNATVYYSQPKQKQFVEEPIGQVANQTYKLFMRTAGPSFSWALNKTTLPAAVLDHGSEPVVLFEPKINNLDNTTITTKNGTWVDLILITDTIPMPPHPIHKHGNKMWQIGNGIGPFPWATAAEAAAAVPQNFNLVDPPKRDGFVTAQATPTNATWTVLRYHVTTPGAWLVHCHVQSHLVGGMSMVIQDGSDHWPAVPGEYLKF